MKGIGQSLSLPCPPVQRAYSKNFNGVDMNDRDSATYSTSIRSNRWYLRVFFWVLDRVIFSCYIVACSLAKSGAKAGWKKYLTKHEGRFMFQCDLALSLLNHAIRTEWPAPFDEKQRPKWMRRDGRYDPCDCNECFFCEEGFCFGISHGTKTAKPTVVQCPQQRVAIRTGGSQECVVCLKNLRAEYPNRNTLQLRQLGCRRDRKGCPTCNKVVCDDHWATFDHGGC